MNDNIKSFIRDVFGISVSILHLIQYGCDIALKFFKKCVKEFEKLIDFLD